MKVKRREAKVAPLIELKPGTTFEVSGHDALFLRTAPVPDLPEINITAVNVETGQLAVIPEDTIVTVIKTQVEILYE